MKAVLPSGLMPMSDILAAIIAERDRLDRAIAILQEPNRRHGTASTTKTIAGSRQGHMSAAARKAQSARMKAFWQAKRKKAAATAAKKA